MMNELAEKIVEVIKPATKIMAEPIVKNNIKRLGLDADKLSKKDLHALISAVEKGVRFFAPDPKTGEEVISELHRTLDLERR